MDLRSIIKLGAATAAMAGTAGIVWHETRLRFFGQTYLQMGTSISGGAGAPDQGTTPIVVGRTLHMTATNAGLDGACAGYSPAPGREQRSLYSVVNSIVSHDWKAQQVEKFPRCQLAIARSQNVNFGELDYLGLEYGANDFGLARPIGRNDDLMPDTFKGALNYSLDRLTSAFPRLRIFLIGPTWRMTKEGQNSDTTPNSAGIFLKDYVEATTSIARQHNLPSLDMWRSLGIGPDNHQRFLIDGVHLNPDGAKWSGQAIAAFMNSVF